MSREPDRPAPAVTALRGVIRVMLLVTLLATLLVSGGLAQDTTPPCDRVATTRLIFGMEGGNMRPARTTLWPDGVITRQQDALSTPDTVRRTDAAVVHLLARRAWAGDVVHHSLSARTALAMRDASHPFIELVSACGGRRADYREHDAPRRFRALLARLDSMKR